MRGQYALHVALAERNAGLQQVTAAGAQYGHLPDAQFGVDQQAIEPVIVEFASADGAKRGNQPGGYAGTTTRRRA